MMARIVKLGLVIAMAFAVPAAAVAHGPEDAAKGLGIAAQHAQGNVPTSVGSGKPEGVGQPEVTGKPEWAGKPEKTGQPENTGKPEDNHGWFVSQAAKDHTTTTATVSHGDSVRDVAMGDLGKPAGATATHP